MAIVYVAKREREGMCGSGFYSKLKKAVPIGSNN